MVPAAKAFALKFGIVARPSNDRPHATTTPQFGGVAIIAGFVVAVALSVNPAGLLDQRLYWLIVFAGAMFVVGLVDDIADLRPRQKLGLELAAIGLLGLWGPQLDVLPNHAANVVLTILWLLAATNAFNLIDGLDGLASGVGIVAAVSIAAVAGLHGHHGTMVAALALAGALSGFLLFNFPPASIFMGDAGALTVGLILGALSIQASHVNEGSLPARLAMPLLALAVPLIDTLTVTVTRLATGNPISKRGLDHSHHRLTRLGLSNTAAAGTLVALQVIAGACAVALGLVPGYEAALLLPYVGLFFALVTLFLMDRTFDAEAPGQVDELPVIARMILSFGYKRRLVEAVLDAALVAGAYIGAMLLRYDFHLEQYNVAMILRGMPFVVLLGCGAFIVAGVYRGIWRYTGLAEGVRFAVASALAGAAVLAASAFLPIAIGRAATIVFVMLTFNLLVATRWSFHLFRRIGRWLAAPTTRAVIVGADAHGQAAIQHLQAALGIGAELVGVIDDDSFKHGKLFQGYPVLGSIDDLSEIIDRTPFDEIVIAQETLSAAQLNALQNFARDRRLFLRRFWLEVTDMTALNNFAANRPGSSPAPAVAPARSAVTIRKSTGSPRS